MEVSETNAKNSEREKKRHLSKSERFPKVFKETIRILREVKTKQKSVKTALYSSKFRGQAFKKVYGLTYNIFKNLSVIDKVINEIGLLQKEPYINLEAAEIMVHEMAIKRSALPGESKPVLTMLKYKDAIDAAYAKYQQESIDTDIPFIPRYVRVHTVATSVAKVIDWFVTMCYKHIILDSDTSLISFIEAVKNLAPSQFLRDYHFADVLVFAPGENLSQTTLYKKGHIFLQDKASYIPVHVLAPPLQSKVLDCCAAPGMKTLHISCAMEKSGKIIALDRDAQRFSTLELAIKHGHATNCELFCLDFSKVDPNMEPYSSVEYILLDPSCSGSGIVSRLDACTDDRFSKNHERLKKLSGFQIVLLKHAMKFPNVKRIVYSTCSVNEEENEFVISESLQHFSDLFKVSNAFPEWETRGSENYSFGQLCVRAYPESNLTNGFFVAVIDRISISNENPEDMVFKCSDQPDFLPNNEFDSVMNSSKNKNLSGPKQKKKKHSNEESTSFTDENEANPIEQVPSERLEKKHKKKKEKPILHKIVPEEKLKVLDTFKIGDETTLCANLEEKIVKKKKRKRTDSTASIDQNQEIEIGVGKQNNEARGIVESVHSSELLNEINEPLDKTSKKRKKSKDCVSENSEFHVENCDMSSKKKKHKKSKLSDDQDVELLNNIDQSEVLEIESNEVLNQSSMKKKKHKKSKSETLDHQNNETLKNVDQSEVLEIESSEDVLNQSCMKKKKPKKSKLEALDHQNGETSKIADQFEVLEIGSNEVLDQSSMKKKKHKKSKSETLNDHSDETSKIVDQPEVLEMEFNEILNQSCKKKKKHKKSKSEAFDY